MLTIPPNVLVVARTVANFGIIVLAYALVIPNCIVPAHGGAPARFAWSGLLVPSIISAFATYFFWFRLKLSPSTIKKPRCPVPEDLIAKHFPWETMSPEEYSARHAYLTGTFSLGEYRYKNPKLEAWLVAVGDIMREVQKIKACREKYLSLEEQQRQEQDSLSARARNCQL